MLLNDAFKPAMQLTNGTINITLRQFAPISDIFQGSVATHLRCSEIISNVIICKCFPDSDSKTISKIG